MWLEGLEGYSRDGSGIEPDLGFRDHGFGVVIATPNP
jgi:hypothetical protein